MTPKTSTIDDIISVRPYDGQNGRIWYYDIVLANGDSGSIGKKSDDALHVGQRITYTAEEGKFGLKIKEYREPFTPGGNGQRTAPSAGGSPFAAGADRNASFALAYAKDIAVALIARSEKPVTAAHAEQVTLEVAEKFLSFLNDRK